MCKIVKFWYFNQKDLTDIISILAWKLKLYSTDWYDNYRWGQLTKVQYMKIKKSTGSFI